MSTRTLFHAGKNRPPFAPVTSLLDLPWGGPTCPGMLFTGVTRRSKCATPCTPQPDALHCCLVLCREEGLTSVEAAACEDPFDLYGLSNLPLLLLPQWLPMARDDALPTVCVPRRSTRSCSSGPDELIGCSARQVGTQ